MYLYLKLKSCTKYTEDEYYLVNKAKIEVVLEYIGDIEDYKVGEILYHSDKDRYHMHIIKVMKIIGKEEFEALKINVVKGPIKIDSHYYVISYAEEN